MQLPDSRSSRAVLIGTSTYATDSGFESLPSVAVSLTEFAKVLRDETGLEHVRIVADPHDSDCFIDALQPAVEQAKDVLIFYFVGHGVALPDLSLTHCRSRTVNPRWNTVPYSNIREEILASTARVKMVILDCCHSGKASGTTTLAGGDVHQTLEDIAAIDGSYVLTATDTKTKFAAAVGASGCTAFTGALVDVLRTGHASDDEYLSMDVVFPLLRTKLKAANLPAPRASGNNTASKLALARNARWTGLRTGRLSATARWSSATGRRREGGLSATAVRSQRPTR